MNILKYLIVATICLVIASCGGSGKNKKREPVHNSKKNIEVIENKKPTVNEEEKREEISSEELQRNNGNYRKPTQRQREESKFHRKNKKGRVIVKPEEDPAKASSARIEKRVQLELDIWEASKKGDKTSVEKLREQADNLAKEMTQPELDEAFKKIKNIKKRM